MKNNELKAVLWDMDGVVADTARQHFESWQYAFRRQKVTFPEEEFKSVFGQRNDIIIRKIMGAGVSPGMIEKVAQDKEEFFRAAVKKNLKPFPGVIRLLITLKENGIRAAIGSSAPLENIQAVLSGLGIGDYFQALVYGLEVQEGKPSPQVFQLAARKLGARPGNCIVIEDAIAGVKAAKSAGMHCIAVTNTHPAASLAEADLVVDSLELIGLNELNMLFSQKLQ
ncbi:MAG TPA: HAD family phosphatase [Dehalococcoidales bacterium]